MLDRFALFTSIIEVNYFCVYSLTVGGSLTENILILTSLFIIAEMLMLDTPATER